MKKLLTATLLASLSVSALAADEVSTSAPLTLRTPLVGGLSVGAGLAVAGGIAAVAIALSSGGGGGGDGGGGGTTGTTGTTGTR